jgi:hypothetical protein
MKAPYDTNQTADEEELHELKMATVTVEIDEDVQTPKKASPQKLEPFHMDAKKRLSTVKEDTYRTSHGGTT